MIARGRRHRGVVPRLAWVSAVAAGSQACGRASPPAVIAVVFNLTDSTVLHLANQDLAARAAAGAPAMSLLFERELPGEQPDAAVARAERLVTIKGLVAIAGHGDSRSSLAAAQVYHAARVPQVVPIGTSRELARAGPWTFMLAPNDSVEGRFISSFVARRLGARRVSLFFQNNEYGMGLRDGVLGGLGAFGLELLTQMAFERGSDFHTLIAASLRQGRPDAVIVAGYSRETIGLALAVHALAPALRVVAGDGVLAGFGPALADSAGAAIDSLIAVAFWVPSRPDSVSQRFVQRFRQVAGRAPAPSEAMLYDGIQALARAAETVGPNPAAIRDYLVELGDQRPAVQGVTGAVRFARERPDNLVMVRVRGGRVYDLQSR